MENPPRVNKHQFVRIRCSLDASLSCAAKWDGAGSTVARDLSQAYFLSSEDSRLKCFWIIAEFTLFVFFGFMQIVSAIIPCLIISPLDCFWDGAKLLKLRGVLPDIVK